MGIYEIIFLGLLALITWKIFSKRKNSSPSKKWSTGRKIGFWIGFIIGMLYAFSQGESDIAWNLGKGAGTGTGIGFVISAVIGLFEKRAKN